MNDFIVYKHTTPNGKSIKEAAEDNRLKRTSISNVLHGRAKTCGGLTFKYCDGGIRQ